MAEDTMNINGADRSTVAFVGLGVMGLPMAANLVGAGFPVRGFDVGEQARADAATAGVEVAPSLTEALRDAGVVITMLPDTPQVLEVAEGAGGIAETCATGTLFIDMSTISPIASAELAERLGRRGIRAIDAPVSGGVKGATEGALSIMVGGDGADVECAAEVFGVLGGRVTHMGPHGAGQATKLCNQVAVAIDIQAVCEAYTLGARLGVDLTKLTEALSGGSSASWVLSNLGPQMLADDPSAGFRIRLQLKDLRLALEAATQLDVPLPAATGVNGLYLEAAAHGEGGNGNQALYKVYERLAGVSLNPLAG
jgi:2-hydroxy-3-oxopropionate reductase